MATACLFDSTWRAAVLAGFATLFSACTSISPSTDSLAAVKVRIEGVYALGEWHFGGEVARPPRVDGRFILLNGAVSTVLHNRLQEAKQTTTASYGSYTLDATRFSYRYEDWSVYVQTASGITVSRRPPWEGMRGFAVLTEDNAIRLRSDNGQQEFLFTADSLTYSENGKVQRVWRRVRSLD